MLMQCDKDHCCLVVTTGGTGPAVRDVTPDATEAVRILVAQLAQRCTQATKRDACPVQVCKRMMPGYGEQMRAISLKYGLAVIQMQHPGLFPKLCFYICALLACWLVVMSQSHQDIRAYCAVPSRAGTCQQLSCPGKQLV